MSSSQHPVLIASIVLSIALIIGACALAYPKQSDYITVGGQAQALINPDGAAVYFTVMSNELTAEDAQATDAKVSEQINQALQALGTGASVETTSFYLNRRTEWTEDGIIEKGFDVSHSFKVWTDVKSTSQVIETAVSAGANGVDRIEYTFSSYAKEAAVTKAMERAALAAEAKAESVAQALGGWAGRPLKIEEGSWWVMPTDDTSLDAIEVPAAYAGSAIMPQRLAVQANVNAVFVLH